jgi:AbrB family transcriptional regulator, stage V sporulation protein T
MKATGIVRRIDALGRIVLPKEYRDINGWGIGTPIEMFSTNEGLVVRKFESSTVKETIIKNLVAVLGQTDDVKIIESVEQALDFLEEN